MGFGGAVWEKLLRYYDTKALRSKCCVRKPDQQYVIPHCLRQDTIFNIGQILHVIPHLLRDLKDKKRSRNKSGMTAVNCHPEAIAEGSQKNS